MSSYIIFIFTIISISHLFIPCLGARTRLRNTLDLKFNLHCDLEECKSNDRNISAINLFQVVSSNPENSDKTNFIWSTIGGPPMVIATSSHNDSNLNINWRSLINATHHKNEIEDLRREDSDLHYDVDQDATIGLMLEKIILYNDTDGNTVFNPSDHHVQLPLSNINWDLASKTTYHKDDFLKTVFRTREPIMNGNLTVKIAIPRDYKADRQKEVPHLKLNGQSISMVIVVDGIKDRENYTHLHFAFVVGVQSPSDGIFLNKYNESLISDEYSPGAFRIKSLQFGVNQSSSEHTETENSFDDDLKPTEKSPKADDLGFFYWKEVAYTNLRKLISRTIDVIDSEEGPYEFKNISELTRSSPAFYQYFKHKPSKGSKYMFYRFELNFGSNDTQYSPTNYVDFSFVFGLKTAPQEQKFSFLVKVIMFICFCLPIAVMIAGLAYLTLKKLSQNSDTELLLAAET